MGFMSPPLVCPRILRISPSEMGENIRDTDASYKSCAMTDSAPRRILAGNFRGGDHLFSYNLTCSAHCPGRSVVGDCAAVTGTAAVTVGAGSSGDGAKTCCAFDVRARTALSHADESVASTKICFGRVGDESVAKYGTTTRAFTCSSSAPTHPREDGNCGDARDVKNVLAEPIFHSSVRLEVLSSALATIEMR